MRLRGIVPAELQISGSTVICCRPIGTEPDRAVGVCGGAMALLWPSGTASAGDWFREVKSIVQFMDRAAAPSLLPVLRSRGRGRFSRCCWVIRVWRSA